MVNIKGNIIYILVCKETVVERRRWAAVSLNCNAFISGNFYKENVFFLLIVLPDFSLLFSLWMSPTERDLSLKTYLGRWLQTSSLPKTESNQYFFCSRQFLFISTSWALLTKLFSCTHSLKALLKSLNKLCFFSVSPKIFCHQINKIITLYNCFTSFFSIIASLFLIILAFWQLQCINIYKMRYSFLFILAVFGLWDLDQPECRISFLFDSSGS